MIKYQELSNGLKIPIVYAWVSGIINIIAFLVMFALTIAGL